MAVVTERRNSGHWIMLRRPERRNALTEEMIGDLVVSLRAAAADSACKYVVITGAGANLCAGGDLAEFDKITAKSSDSQAQAALDQFGKITLPWFEATRAVPQPILVAARGHAIGAGAQLVFAADLVIASPTLRLTLPQVRLGHALDHGESWTLPRKVGLAKAMEMALLGDIFDAEAAARAGLVNWIVADDELEARTELIAARLAQSAGEALLETKALILASAEADYLAQLWREGEALSRCVRSPDFAEAIVAFKEKRSARFA